MFVFFSKTLRRKVTFVAIIIIITYGRLGHSSPPSQCLEDFRWDDCGQPSKPVMYYWKPGSRCEVGFWRGCPTLNMFANELECVSTCIFARTAQESDWHEINNDNSDYNNIGMADLPDYDLENGDNATIHTDPAPTTTVYTDPLPSTSPEETSSSDSTESPTTEETTTESTPEPPTTQ